MDEELEAERKRLVGKTWKCPYADCVPGYHEVTSVFRSPEHGVRAGVLNNGSMAATLFTEEHSFEESVP